MKEQKAILRYLRIAPRKVRLVADTLKGLSANEAEARLLLISQKAHRPLLKLLRSVIANAKNTKQLPAENLFVKEIRIDQGPMKKSWIPRAYGRGTPIQKKTSHITLILAELEKPKIPKFKITKPEKIKKTEAEKIKKMGQKEKEGKEVKEKAKGSGFMKKMFRRKSI